MSNGKWVLVVALMIGGMALGVREGGKSFFREMVGGGPFPDRKEMQQAAKTRQPAPAREEHVVAERSEEEMEELRLDAERLRQQQAELQAAAIAARVAAKMSEEGEFVPEEF